MKKEVKLEKGMRWKSGKIEYRPYIKIDGEVIRKSFRGNSPTEVKRMRDKFLLGEKAKREAKINKNLLTPTVYEVGRDWVDVYKKHTVSSGSYKNYNMYLENHIHASNIDKPVHQLDADDIQIFFNQRNWMSKSAINYLQIIINNIIKSSMKKGFINKNIMEDINLPKQPNTPVYAFDADSSKRIYDFTFEHYFGLPVRVLLTIGCRPGELIALPWDDINIVARSIHIHHTLSKADVGFEIRDTTKTGIERDAYIHDAIYDDMIVGKYIYNNRVKLAKKEKRPLPPPYVFTYKDTHMTHGSFDYHYKVFFDALNATLPDGEKIEYKSPNKCRTTFATTMLNLTGNIRVVQEALGHTDVKTTQRYTNPSFFDLKINAQKLKY